MRLKSGYTLIEILVVIGIVLVLSVVIISVVKPKTQRDRTNDAVVQKAVADISTAIEIFKAANGRYPTTSDVTNLQPYINTSFTIATASGLVSFYSASVDNGSTSKKIYWDPTAVCLQSPLNIKSGAAKTYAFWSPTSTNTKIQTGTAGCSSAIASAP